MRNVFARAAFVSLVAGACSGCVAAVIPLMIASTAASGFFVYKSVQTASGGRLSVSFAGEKDGAPLPSLQSVAVWPGGEREVRFADRLATAGRIAVTSPSTTGTALASARINPDLKTLTEADRARAFALICQTSRAQMVFAAQDQGVGAESNIFSFNRGTVSQKTDLLGYSCATRSFVWREQMVVAQEVGGTLASDSEAAKLGGEAWADRVIQAAGKLPG